MKRILTISHWKMFLILTSSIFLSILSSEIDFRIANFNNVSLSIIIRIIGLIVYFLWIMVLGLSLRNKLVHYKFNRLLFLLSVFFCIAGYSEMNINVIYEGYEMPGLVKLLLTLLTLLSLGYVFYSISKAFKSIELQRKVSFFECLLEAFFLFFFPVGIWIIQPRINKIFRE